MCFMLDIVCYDANFAVHVCGVNVQWCNALHRDIYTNDILNVIGEIFTLSYTQFHENIYTKVFTLTV